MAVKFDNSIKIGVLGGGQLGRMLIQSAIDLDLDIAILDPDPHAPCKSLCNKFVQGAFQDYETVVSFGKDLDLISIEIENVNIEALKKLRSMGKKIFPQPEVIELIQDKRTQKKFYRDHHIPTADFVLTENKAHASEYVHFLPAFHKLGKGGYDGKGVQPILNINDFTNAFDQPGLLEKKVDYQKEISVIVARNEVGEICSFPVVEMVFDPVYNLVDYLISPAQIEEKYRSQADLVAKKVAESLKIVGILAVEMFLTKEGEILVNEIAPRPHNSGHHTIKANTTSQYEQHWRAILGLPFGNTNAHKLSAMINVLGTKGYEGEAVYVGLHEVLKLDGAHIHLYGKKKTKSSRKMGHIIIMDDNLESLQEKVKYVKETIQVIA
ncbi:MAG TPA: 5-(carboxyamino)imidazole ribonucleotide synthase [Cytophagales bacterium]|nr:5-(carboxyamino)imidazole ribonucleotide synthase [Cytophagales bacterium]